MFNTYAFNGNGLQREAEVNNVKKFLQRQLTIQSIILETMKYVNFDTYIVFILILVSKEWYKLLGWLKGRPSPQNFSIFTNFVLLNLLTVFVANIRNHEMTIMKYVNIDVIALFFRRNCIAKGSENHTFVIKIFTKVIQHINSRGIYLGIH